MTSDGFYVVISPGTYQRIPATLTKWVRQPQTPTFTPDEISFKVSKSVPIRPLEEIIYVQDGTHVFHGNVSKRDDNKSMWSITCKSSQWLLNYRYIPYLIYHKGKTSNCNLNVILSSDAPTISPGMLWLVNSLIPQGGFTRYSTLYDKLYSSSTGLRKRIEQCSVYACTTFPNPDTTVDANDGIKLLSLRESGTLAANQYRIEGTEDTSLLVRFGTFAYGPNAYLVMAANAFDTRIRLKSCSLGAKIPNIDFSLEGIASTQLADFVNKLGLEAAFRPNNRGYVDLIMAAEIAKGSSAEPIKVFTDGENCKITISDTKTPPCQAVIGLNTDDNPQPKTAYNWALTNDRPQLFEIYENNSMTLEQVAAASAARLEQDDNSLTVKTNEVLPHIWPGDYVGLWKEELGSKIYRVTKITITPAGTELVAGRRLFSISETFGEYFRKTRQTTAKDPTTKKTIAETEITDGSGSFTIASANLAKDGFVVKYSESFSLPDEASDILGAFCDLKINDVVVPPGRLRADTGSIEIDITDACKAGKNTILRKLYGANGWTSNGGQISQYLFLAFIDA